MDKCWDHGFCSVCGGETVHVRAAHEAGCAVQEVTHLRGALERITEEASNGKLAFADTIHKIAQDALNWRGSKRPIPPGGNDADEDAIAQAVQDDITREVLEALWNGDIKLTPEERGWICQALDEQERAKGQL